MNLRMRKLSDSELNSVSGGRVAPVRSTCTVQRLTVTGVMDNGAPILEYSNPMPCPVVSDPGYSFPSTQDLMGGEPCD
jgi:bacteriocin-like protein